jgi:hypothetical protein
VRATDRPDVLTVSLEPDPGLTSQLASQTEWAAKVRIANSYLDFSSGMRHIADAPRYAQLTALAHALAGNPDVHGDALRTVVDQNVPAPRPDLEQDYFQVSSNFLCLYIAPRRDRPTLPQLAELLRLLWLVMLVQRRDPRLADKGVAGEVLAATVTVPPQVFTVPRDQVFPIGVADLVLVKQHISGYELGEVAHVENILRGETRTHTQKHSVTNERSSTVETETTKETDKELTTKDTVSLRNEVQNTITEQLKLNTGVQVKVGGGSSSYSVESNLNFSYDRSSSSASKSAQELSKDVTQKSASKLTERIKEVLQTKVTEVLEELEDQNFDNAKGAANISGVYRWVEKVYTAQMFNYGKRLLFDLTVPEPAAFLIQAANKASAAGAPVPPPPLTLDGTPAAKPLRPSDLSESVSNGMDPNPAFYGNFVSRYQVTGVTPPPSLYITVAKAFAERETDNNDIRIDDTIRIDDGYQAATIHVKLAWYHRVPTAGGNDSQVEIAVGRRRFHFANGGHSGNDQNASDQKDYDYATDNLEGERESMAYSVETVWTSQVAGTIEVRCVRTPDLFAQWQLETYGKIAARWQKMQEDYEAKLAAIQFAPPITPFGRDPATNRITEMIELKRSCLALLRGEYLGSFDDVTDQPPGAPDAVPFPKLGQAELDGAVVRFFEQAFEWENIGYVFYPYFWGRQKNWPTALDMANQDPLFEQFLKAGYARVVIPVRPAFNDAINYFLTTNQVWQGGSLPAVSDPTYLPIAEEIKNQEGAPGNEVPQGDPWKFRLPADLIKLQPDDVLPTWHWAGHGDASEGNWSWTEAPEHAAISGDGSRVPIAAAVFSGNADGTTAPPVP